MPSPDLSAMRLASLNHALQEELGLVGDLKEMNTVSEWVLDASQPMAMAYAGHQYGHFTMLGDGRALLLGEWQNDLGICYDVHLKGSGPTPFARGGDGLATLRAMLREFMISEALHGLGVPTTRSLMVLETPFKVWRDVDQRGGLLFRTAPHHGRIGTLEYAIRALSPENYARYTMAILDRTTRCWSGTSSIDQEQGLYTLGNSDPDGVRSFFEEWSKRQAELVAHWMRVGFVHGVLNTDNISLLGITMDLGPCAFVNSYDLNRSFSSIDSHGRYAWGRQSEIMEWNAGVLLSCLLPLLDGDQKETRAMMIAKELFQQYRDFSKQALECMQWMKLGLDPQRFQSNKEAHSLVSNWQAWLVQARPDYYLAYLNLEDKIQQAMQLDSEAHLVDGLELESAWTISQDDLPSKAWVAQWINFLKKAGEDACQDALSLMQSQNPNLIPRNHLVENVLDQMVLYNNDADWDELMAAMREPYQRGGLNRRLNQPPPLSDAGYCTFCGT